MIVPLTKFFLYYRETKILARSRTLQEQRISMTETRTECPVTQRWQQGPSSNTVSAFCGCLRHFTLFTGEMTCVYFCVFLLACTLGIAASSNDRKPANEPSSPASVSIPHNNYSNSGSKVAQLENSAYANKDGHRRGGQRGTSSRN